MGLFNRKEKKKANIVETFNIINSKLKSFFPNEDTEEIYDKMGLDVNNLKPEEILAVSSYLFAYSSKTTKGSIFENRLDLIFEYVSFVCMTSYIPLSMDIKDHELAEEVSWNYYQCFLSAILEDFLILLILDIDDINERMQYLAKVFDNRYKLYLEAFNSSDCNAIIDLFTLLSLNAYNNDKLTIYKKKPLEPKYGLNDERKIAEQSKLLSGGAITAVYDLTAILIKYYNL